MYSMNPQSNETPIKNERKTFSITSKDRQTPTQPITIPKNK